MENKKIQNGINEIKKITMTSLEKEKMLGNILNSSLQKKYQVRSFWATDFFIYIKKNNHLVYYVVIPLIVILSGGGIVFASEMSLPDSIFYPIKVNVIEPIRESLIFSPEAKARYESNLATKRLIEAETLLDEGKLDKVKEKTLNDLLDIHTSSLNDTLGKFNKKETAEHKDEIITNFQDEMNAHAERIETISKKEQKEENDDKDIEISDTARDNADKIKENQREKESTNESDNSNETLNEED